MHQTVVIDVVGLCSRVLGPGAPRMNAFAERTGRARIRPTFPAVTCSAQSDYVTGVRGNQHGIVGNGWYDRSLAEPMFWKQPDMMVQAPKIWERLRALDAGFSCAKTFWWYNMYSDVEFSVTPRPMYPADGRKVFDIYTHPYSLRPDLKEAFGAFPFPTFWGPVAGTPSKFGPPEAVSAWIANAAKWIDERHEPTLQLIYLPHLDYNYQRWGAEDPRLGDDLKRIDALVGDLIETFESRGRRVLLVSEYGITTVDRPVSLNRVFREKGWLTIKEELGLELIDFGASRAFAVADHQVAHVYVNDSEILPEVRRVLESVEGVGRILADEDAKREAGVNHPRAGDIVVESTPEAWFTYYYWFEDRRAPDFARCVDIHRKPGYDPVELFFNPKLKGVQARVAWKLLRKKLGFRTLMDLIPLDASLVKGSHGRIPEDAEDWPVLIGEGASGSVESTDVYSAMERSVLDGGA